MFYEIIYFENVIRLAPKPRDTEGHVLFCSLLISESEYFNLNVNAGMMEDLCHCGTVSASSSTWRFVPESSLTFFFVPVVSGPSGTFIRRLFNTFRTSHDTFEPTFATIRSLEDFRTTFAAGASTTVLAIFQYVSQVAPNKNTSIFIIYLLSTNRYSGQRKYNFS